MHMSILLWAHNYGRYRVYSVKVAASLLSLVPRRARAGCWRGNEAKVYLYTMVILLNPLPTIRNS